jgi:cell division protein FtsZ
VDTLIIIPNQNLFRVANEKTTFADAFAMADDVLHAGVRGVTDLMVMPGLINLDFADVKAVMSEMGKAMMGTGQAEGEQRAQEAAEAAISNPLLDNVSMKGARGVLINITGGSDLTLFEVDEAANRIRQEVDSDANIIFGSTFSDELEGKIRVSVVATGIDVDESLKEQDNAPAVSVAAPEQPANEEQASAEESQDDLQAVASGQGDGALEEMMAGLNAEYEAQKEQVDPSAASEGFIPKAPITPESYHDEVLAAATSQAGSGSVESEPTVRRPFSKQIFSKVAEMARSFQGKDSAILHTPTQNSAPVQAPTQAQPQPVQQDLNVSTESLGSDTEEEGATQEDMMDIPAFLRRKKSVNE